MWIVSQFLKKTARQALSSRFRLWKERKKYLEGKLTSQCAVVNHLLEEYAPEEIIAENTAEKNSWKKKEGQTETNFSQKLWEKFLRCSQEH